mmetsp:Transcript_78796/g.231190  ORF Transcript_78796/g.231190 Transcript_78796/m.231190 type:complete len:356 (+) Transcript_78796:90-1157(+)
MRCEAAERLEIWELRAWAHEVGAHQENVEAALDPGHSVAARRGGRGDGGDRRAVDVGAGDVGLAAGVRGPAVQREAVLEPEVPVVLDLDDPWPEGLRQAEEHPEVARVDVDHHNAWLQWHVVLSEDINNVLRCDGLLVNTPTRLMVCLVKGHAAPAQASKILAVALRPEHAQGGPIAKLHEEVGTRRRDEPFWVHEQEVEHRVLVHLRVPAPPRVELEARQHLPHRQALPRRPAEAAPLWATGARVGGQGAFAMAFIGKVVAGAQPAAARHLSEVAHAVRAGVAVAEAVPVPAGLRRPGARGRRGRAGLAVGAPQGVGAMHAAVVRVAVVPKDRHERIAPAGAVGNDAVVPAAWL